MEQLHFESITLYTLHYCQRHVYKNRNFFFSRKRKSILNFPFECFGVCILLILFFICRHCRRRLRRRFILFEVTKKNLFEKLRKQVSVMLLAT